MRAHMLLSGMFTLEELRNKYDHDSLKAFLAFADKGAVAMAATRDLQAVKLAGELKGRFGDKKMMVTMSYREIKY